MTKVALPRKKFSNACKASLFVIYPPRVTFFALAISSMTPQTYAIVHTYVMNSPYMFITVLFYNLFINSKEF
ncbi:hypothetical protein A6D94_19105 [Vibrio splendidus]|nr:hypothetical protein A6D94_19105 [Vibrio splendidus]